MKKFRFKEHNVRRSPGIHFNELSEYTAFLKIDFDHHCCYCNTLDLLIEPLPFQKDHFVPRDVFEKRKCGNLDNDYNNLMYSCPKCNGTKGKKHSGDIGNGKIINECFYNPVEIDYNTIFYRNEFGLIESDDIKGRQMIKDLRLYRKLHAFAYVLEKYKKTLELLQDKYDNEKNIEKKYIFEKALFNVQKKYIEYGTLYRSNYYSKELNY